MLTIDNLQGCSVPNIGENRGKTGRKAQMLFKANSIQPEADER